MPHKNSRNRHFNSFSQVYPGEVAVDSFKLPNRGYEKSFNLVVFFQTLPHIQFLPYFNLVVLPLTFPTFRPYFLLPIPNFSHIQTLLSSTYQKKSLSIVISGVINGPVMELRFEREGGTFQWKVSYILCRTIWRTFQKNNMKKKIRIKVI